MAISRRHRGLADETGDAMVGFMVESALDELRAWMLPDDLDTPSAMTPEQRRKVRDATIYVSPAYPLVVTFERIAINRGALCIECKACERRRALTQEDCPQIHVGNWRPVSDRMPEGCVRKAGGCEGTRLSESFCGFHRMGWRSRRKGVRRFTING